MMTIKEAVAAARASVPVVYEDPVFGPMLFKRISVISKIYPDGEESERYELTLASFRTQLGGMTNIDPGDVRIAEPGEISQREERDG